MLIINAESILQIVVSRIKCLFIKTFCRFFRVFFFFPLCPLALRDALTVSLSGMVCFVFFSDVWHFFFSFCCPSVHISIFDFIPILLRSSQHDTALCWPFCVIGFIFSSVTSVSLSKFPEMAGDSFSTLLFTAPTSTSPMHPVVFCSSSSWHMMLWGIS